MISSESHLHDHAINHHIHAAVIAFFSPFKRDLLRLRKEFQTSMWFVRSLKSFQGQELVSYLSLSREGEEVQTLDHLVKSYQKPCTMEGIIHLCQAIFGKNAYIWIESSKGMVSLVLGNVNESFIKGIIDKIFHKAILEQNNLWITAETFERLKASSLESFFQQFLPCGVQLSIIINPRSNHEQ